mgnify:FL=1
MTKQDKITLYKTALQYIAENKETVTGLCWMLQVISHSYRIDEDIYDGLEMKSANGLFTKAKLGGFEELTDQMIGKPDTEYSDTEYWFPQGDWESRKQLLLNAINILENETT